MKRVRVHLSATSSADKAHRAGDDPFNDLLGRSFEEKPIWAGLYEGLRDVMFPAQLPPLELTSLPISTPDRMAARTNPWAIGTATIVNGGVARNNLFNVLRIEVFASDNKQVFLPADHEQFVFKIESKITSVIPAMNECAGRKIGPIVVSLKQTVALDMNLANVSVFEKFARIGDNANLVVGQQSAG